VTTANTLRLILGDQLNLQHPWFKQVYSKTIYALMEVRQETDAVPQHIQRLTGFFCCMRYVAATLSRTGHRVVYIRLDDPKNEQCFEGNLLRLIQAEDVDRFESLLPDDYRLDHHLADIVSRLPI